MKAGIDCGTSRIKAAWRDAGGMHRFFSSSDVCEVADRLKKEGVTKLRVTGIGGRVPEGFDVVGPADDPIADEIALQSEGARRLLAAQGGPDAGFLLVSVGTGTSYTLVPDRGDPRRFPLGNAIGGGFIAGLAAWQAVDRSAIDGFASRGRPRDVLIKDLVPAKDGTLEGEFVVSHFGKDEVMGACVIPEGGRPLDDYCATIVHCAAVTVIRDVMLIGMIEGFAAEDVVFIGTPVAKMTALVGHLSRYAAALGKRAHFPENGEYAAALGALYAP
ncbi:MAG TPA: hypothetical protein VLC10_03155 [Patescibacteria group bacterium]|nr:hypothetical protein [Patescibacteria group bacterium]